MTWSSSEDVIVAVAVDFAADTLAEDVNVGSHFASAPAGRRKGSVGIEDGRRKGSYRWQMGREEERLAVIVET